MTGIVAPGCRAPSRRRPPNAPSGGHRSGGSDIPGTGTAGRGLPAPGVTRARWSASCGRRPGARQAVGRRRGRTARRRRDVPRVPGPRTQRRLRRSCAVIPANFAHKHRAGAETSAFPAACGPTGLLQFTSDQAVEESVADKNHATSFHRTILQGLRGASGACRGHRATLRLLVDAEHPEDAGSHDRGGISHCQPAERQPGGQLRLTIVCIGVGSVRGGSRGAGYCRLTPLSSCPGEYANRRPATLPSPKWSQRPGSRRGPGACRRCAADTRGRTSRRRGPSGRG